MVCHGQQTIANRFTTMTLRSTCLAVATVDAETIESHPTSGRVSSKGAITGSRKWKTLIGDLCKCFFPCGHCVVIGPDYNLKSCTICALHRIRCSWIGEHVNNIYAVHRYTNSITCLSNGEWSGIQSMCDDSVFSATL